MKPFLSIIIPAYNEEENFHKGSLRKVSSYLKKASFSFELIIIDDGSQDKTVQLIKGFIKDRKNWQLIENPHQGKAETIKTGVYQAKGRYILFTDFDQATPLAEVEKLLPFLKRGFDIVVGSREVKGAKREEEPFYRHLMGKVFNLIVQLIALPGVHDTQCGFKLFKAKIIKDLFSRLKIEHKETKRAFTGAFDVEILFLAQKKGYKIAEVPVSWKHFQTTRINPIKDSLRMFVDVLRVRFYDLLGRYEKEI